MKRIMTGAMCLVICCAFNFKNSFTGIWEYSGGIYNGKPTGASKNYQLQRKYNGEHYEASFLEPDEQPVTYERGDYIVKRPPQQPA